MADVVRRKCVFDCCSFATERKQLSSDLEECKKEKAAFSARYVSCVAILRTQYHSYVSRHRISCENQIGEIMSLKQQSQSSIEVLKIEMDCLRAELKREQDL